ATRRFLPSRDDEAVGSSRPFADLGQAPASLARRSPNVRSATKRSRAISAVQEKHRGSWGDVHGSRRFMRGVCAPRGCHIGLERLLVACSQAPPKPAPVFALPLSKIVGATPNSQDPPLTAASPPTRQLRYVAVPPGRSVAGMAHAPLVLKQPTAPHPSAPPQKKIIAQPKTVRAPGRKHARATIGPPSSAVPAAMIPLDEPAAAKPTSSQ